MLKRVAEGERPLYRDGEFQQEERWRVKVSNKVLWSKTDSVLFLPLSERLKTVAMENIKRVRENIRVVERGGRSLKSVLQRSDPYKEPLCQDQTCAICTAGGGGQKTFFNYRKHLAIGCRRWRASPERSASGQNLEQAAGAMVSSADRSPRGAQP